MVVMSLAKIVKVYKCFKNEKNSPNFRDTETFSPNFQISRSDSKVIKFGRTVKLSLEY